MKLEHPWNANSLKEISYTNREKEVTKIRNAKRKIFVQICEKVQVCHYLNQDKKATIGLEALQNMSHQPPNQLSTPNDHTSDD